MQNCLTPAKEENTPLKTAILQRISSKKKKTIQQTTSSKTPIESSKFQQSQLTCSQQLILSFQNTNSPGFFSYLDWVSFNEQVFKVTKNIIDDLWKIMRILNYGQVLIPSGLIHDVYLQLIQKEKKGGLEGVFNYFLKSNQIRDSVKGFKEISHYTDLKTIEQQYKGIKPEKKQNKRAKSAYNSSAKCTPQSKKKDVFTRIHEQARTRTNKKMALVCSSLARQMSEHKFKPQIHKYQTNQKLTKPQRICHHKQIWKQKPQQDIEPLFKVLKAKKIDETLFSVDIDQIPGVLEHISRNKYSQAQKQRLKRYQQRPVYSGKKKV